MVLSPEDRVRYTALLAEAEAAYHSVMIGGQVVDFSDQNGERVRYSAANAGRLHAYINGLRSLLGLCPYMLPHVSPPAGVLF